jgi:recombinational DNA repair protein RecT
MHTHDITGQIFKDQTGHFPITSNQGHAYLVIFYVYNANFISSVPIKNCTKEELLHAY